MKMRSISKRLTALMCLLAVVSGLSAHAQSIIPQKDEKKGLWGYVSKSDGKWVVKPKFDEATELTASPNGQLRGTVTQKGKKGFIDDSGKILGAGAVFEEITPMQGDAMFVKVKGKTGVADYSGVYKVKPEAENVEQLGDEGWIVTVKGKKGLLKNDGTWLIDPMFNEIQSSTPGFFIVDKGGKAGILDRNGQSKLVPGVYSKVEKLGDFWKVYKGDKVGLFDLASNALRVDVKYSDVDLPIKTRSGVWYPVEKNGKRGFLYSNGKWAIKPEYSSYFILSDPQAIVLSENSSPNYIYFPGDEKIGKIYKYTKDKKYIFDEVNIACDRDGLYSSISIVSLPNGKTLISPKITKEGDFYQVKDGIKISLWDYEGNMIYEGDSHLGDVEKYIIFAKRADEDPKWKSYVNILKENVIKDFSSNEKNGNDYNNIRKLTVAKDKIGVDNLNILLHAYPIDKRVSLIEEAYGKDKELGLFLLKFYDNEELSSDDKNKLFNFAEANGLIKDFKIGDFEYKIISRGEVSAKYLGNASNVVFPSSVSDEEGNVYSVTEVLGVDNKNSLVSVEIPSSVKKISEKGFADCKNLTTVLAPDSISLGYYAFNGCKNLNYFKNSILDSQNPEVLYSYISFTNNCPKILKKICSNFEAGYDDKNKLVDFAFHNLLGMDKGYWIDHGHWSSYEELKKYGADILRRYAAKGNIDAIAYLICSMLDNEGRQYFNDSEFVQNAKRLIPKNPAYGYYYMGVAYELGIGVKPSRSTAHSYYAKGRELNNSDCDNGWWRTL